MAFNTERVARAIRATRVPVVSGVGHEVDVTIADLAADLRAPTPSAAAAAVTPEADALRESLARDARRLLRAALAARDEASGRLALARTALRAQAPEARLEEQARRIEGARRALRAALRARLGPERTRVQSLQERLGLASHGILAPAASRLDASRQRLSLRATRLAPEARARLQALAGRLEALSPLAVLSRGYAIARRADGSVVRHHADASPGDALSLRVASAQLGVVVQSVEELDEGS